MMANSKVQFFLLCLALICLTLPLVQPRYLPTRSQEDRLVRLKELLRQLIESETESQVPHAASQIHPYDYPRLYKRAMDPLLPVPIYE